MNKEAFHEHKIEKGHEEDDSRNVIGADGKCSNVGIVRNKNICTTNIQK